MVVIHTHAMVAAFQYLHFSIRKVSVDKNRMEHCVAVMVSLSRCSPCLTARNSLNFTV